MDDHENQVEKLKAHIQQLIMEALLQGEQVGRMIMRAQAAFVASEEGNEDLAEKINKIPLNQMAGDFGPPQGALN